MVGIKVEQYVVKSTDLVEACISIPLVDKNPSITYDRGRIGLYVGGELKNSRRELFSSSSVSKLIRPWSYVMDGFLSIYK